MLLIEDVAALLIRVVAVLVAIKLAFLFLIFYRRVTRRRYYVTKDAARARYRSIVARFTDGELGVNEAVAALTTANAPAHQDAINELLLARVTPQTAARITDLFYALGHIHRWTRAVFGRGRGSDRLVEEVMRGEPVSARPPRPRWVERIRRLRVFSIPRAIALGHLARLTPPVAHALATEAVRDPSAEVRQVAILTLGAAHDPAAIPLLLDELRRAAELGNDVSVRSIKAALSRCKIEDLHRFLPWLGHPTPRVRFLVVDTVRDICNRAEMQMVLNKNDFSPEFYTAFLERVIRDDNPDVRARSAAVVRHFRDRAAVDALSLLMADDNHFVRLHAVRAAGGYAALMPDLVRRVTDDSWRVREAAVRTLAAFGVSGINEIYRHFTTSTDPYANEQVADEIQRDGLVSDLIGSLVATDASRQLGIATCQKLARMGKGSVLNAAVASLRLPEPRIVLMEALMVAPTDELLELLDLLSRNETGPVAETAARLLQGHAQGTPGSSLA